MPNEQTPETRNGIIFDTRVEQLGKTKIYFVYLLVNGQEIDFFRIDTSAMLSTDNLQLVDIVLQEWVIWGHFDELPMDASLRAMLTIAQEERLAGTPWYKRTYRFLPASDSSRQNPRFILTDDKSDLSPYYKRILEVGEAVAQKEAKEAKKRDQRAEMQNRKERDRYLLEELPRDTELRDVFQEAIDGKCRVALVVKGSRPMYKPCAPYGFNYFYFEGYQKDFGCVPVPSVCTLAGVDASLVQNVYFHLRNHERWPRLRPELDQEIAEAQYQAVTNLFPFSEIDWKRESGSTGEIYLLRTVIRTPPFLTEDELRMQFMPSRQIEKAMHRHSRKKYRKS